MDCNHFAMNSLKQNFIHQTSSSDQHLTENSLKRKRMDSDLHPEVKKMRTETPEEEPHSGENVKNPLKRKRSDSPHQVPKAHHEEAPEKRRRTETPILEDIIQSDSARLLAELNEHVVVEGVIGSHVRYHVCGEELESCDFKTLQHPSWINDKVINTYLTVLRHEVNNEPTQRNHMFNMPSFTAVMWETNRFNWMFKKVQFSKMKWIFLPINVNSNHWILLVADVTRMEVSILDSEGRSMRHEKYMTLWKRYMSTRAKVTNELAGEWRPGNLSSARQKDVSSCGAFVMMNALALTRSMDPLSLSQTHALAMRKYVTDKLLQNAEGHPTSSTQTPADLPQCISPGGQPTGDIPQCISPPGQPKGGNVKNPLKRKRTDSPHPVPEAHHEEAPEETPEDVTQSDSARLLAQLNEHVVVEGVIGSHARYHVCGEELESCDFKTLQHPSWINDKVINTYLTVLRHEVNKEPTQRNHMFNMPSFTAVMWETNRFNWMFKKVQFSKMKWIFLPINVNSNHWILLVADVTRMEVSILDSEGRSMRHEKYMTLWKRYMSARAKVTNELAGEWRPGNLSSARQKDVSSCGAFVMMNALALTRSMDPLSLSQSHALAMRKYVTDKLLQNAEGHPTSSTQTPADPPQCISPAGQPTGDIPQFISPAGQPTRDIPQCIIPAGQAWQVASNAGGRWSRERPRANYVIQVPTILPISQLGHGVGHHTPTYHYQTYLIQPVLLLPGVSSFPPRMDLQDEHPRNP